MYLVGSVILFWIKYYWFRQDMVVKLICIILLNKKMEGEIYSRRSFLRKSKYPRTNTCANNKSHCAGNSSFLLSYLHSRLLLSQVHGSFLRLCYKGSSSKPCALLLLAFAGTSVIAAAEKKRKETDSYTYESLNCSVCDRKGRFASYILYLKERFVLFVGWFLSHGGITQALLYSLGDSRKEEDEDMHMHCISMREREMGMEWVDNKLKFPKNLGSGPMWLVCP